MGSLDISVDLVALSFQAFVTVRDLVYFVFYSHGNKVLLFGKNVELYGNSPAAGYLLKQDVHQYLGAS